MRARQSISRRERRSIRFDGFRGVDFSSSPLDVKAYRSPHARNIINEYGINRKRNGWDELFRITLGEDEGAAINGIFEYVRAGVRHIIIHAGRRFYRVTGGLSEITAEDIEDITLSSTYEDATVDESRLKDQRSQVFFSGDRAYIIGCGDYLVYGTWNGGESYELRRVYNNEDTYIPTTTTHISFKSPALDNTSGGEMRDNVNLLTSWRYNTAIGSDATSNGSICYLDSIPDEDSPIEIEVCGRYGKTRYFEGVDTDESSELKIVDKEDGLTAGRFVKSSGKLTLVGNWSPEIEGEPNIKIKFKRTVEGYEQRITDCEFGTLFGNDGASDRLFLSGNSKLANIDFYSQINDFTYFGDQSTAAMGGESVPIRGYSRLSDSTLVVHKATSTIEPTIFYRTGKYNTILDDDGEVAGVDELFPFTAGGIGEGAVGPFACSNFLGDNLFLSKNGVFGVALSENVASTARFVRDRSRLINRRLTAHDDLSDAVGCVFQNKYFLAIDGVCYVADARYKHSIEDNIDGAFNYEWWYWDNIPARVFAVIDDRLYFGCEDGRVCVFDGGFTDRTYQTTRLGDLSLDVSTNRFIYNQNIKIPIKNGDRLTLISDDVYSLLIDSFELGGGRVFVDAAALDIIHEGDEVFADEVGESGLELSTPYYICDVDRGEMSFALSDGAGKEVKPASEDFRLLKSVSGRELYIAELDESSFKLSFSPGGELLHLCGYNGHTPSDITARFRHDESIVAEWHTPVLDLGANDMLKSLVRMTVTAEPLYQGRVTFGYETIDGSQMLDAASGGESFTFEDIDFESFSFNTGFASSHSVSCYEKNFNYVLFKLAYDDEHCAAVNSLTVVYTINKEQKGVR